MSVLKAKVSRLTSTCFLFPKKHFAVDWTKSDFTQVQKWPLEVALASLHVLAQRGLGDLTTSVKSC